MNWNIVRNIIIEIAIGHQVLFISFFAPSLGFTRSVSSQWFSMHSKGEGILDALARGSIILSALTVRSNLALLFSVVRMTGGEVGR